MAIVDKRIRVVRIVTPKPDTKYFDSDGTEIQTYIVGSDVLIKIHGNHFSMYNENGFTTVGVRATYYTTTNMELSDDGKTAYIFLFGLGGEILVTA